MSAAAPQRAAKATASWALEARREREREPGREAVSRPVCVHDLAGRRRRGERAAGAGPAAQRPRRRDDELGSRVELAGAVPLRLVVAASDQCVERDGRALEDFELAGRRGQDARATRVDEGIGVAGHEEDRVHRRQLVPRKPLVVPTRTRLGADRGDRPLPVLVDVGERPALRALVGGVVHDDPARLELGLRTSPEIVVAECGEQVRLVGEERELDGGDAPTASRLLPLIERVGDLSCRRHPLDTREPDPLDVPDDGDAHAESLPVSARQAGFGRSRILRLDPRLRRADP